MIEDAITARIIGCAIAVHKAYRKIMQPVGLILNFNTPWMKCGIARIVNPTFLL